MISVHGRINLMLIATRPAVNSDFDYCRCLYFGEMKWMINELHLDLAAQENGFQQQWNQMQVRIITLDGADVGWVQTIRQEEGLFVAQIIVEHRFQRRGIGTEIMKRLILEAEQIGLPVLLSVVKINPARTLYQRLGFHVTDEDERKFHMKRDVNIDHRV